MKHTALSVVLFLCSMFSIAQTNTDSCSFEISLLTCAPGTDLYSIFGHTGIRVRDERRGMDIVYNYGTFDDTDPAFYFKFTRGIMRYSLAANTFENFMLEYEYEHRPVKSQLLNLTCTEKLQLYEALRKNTLEENRLYDYHFHTDNCTTRAGRMLEANTSGFLIYGNILPSPGPSFRDMIHEYLNPQHQYWPAFGIDMLLGKNLDIKPTNLEAIHFLPDYLYRGTDGATTGGKPLVLARKTLIDFPEEKSSAGWFTPIVFFTALFLLAVLLFFMKGTRGSKGLILFDIIFFSLLGLAGLLISTVWIIRVDDVCRNNMNILWALPTHIVAVFFLRKKASWIKYYFLMTALIAGILFIGFPWWTQRMNLAVLPILGTIMFRGFALFQNRNHAEKSVI